MAVGTDGSLQLDGAGHASVFEREVGIFGVWEGAAGIQKGRVHEVTDGSSLTFEQSLKPPRFEVMPVFCHCHSVTDSILQYIRALGELIFRVNVAAEHNVV